MAKISGKLGQLMPLLILGGVWFLFKKISGGGGILNQIFGTTEAQENTNEVGEVIQATPVNLSRATLGISQAKVLAEKLQKACNPISGFSPDYDGTNEDLILEVFSKIINSDDAKLVFREFGLRQYTTNWFLDNQRIDLHGWLSAELSSSMLSKIRTKLNWML